MGHFEPVDRREKGHFHGDVKNSLHRGRAEARTIGFPWSLLDSTSMVPVSPVSSAAELFGVCSRWQNGSSHNNQQGGCEL